MELHGSQGHSQLPCRDSHGSPNEEELVAEDIAKAACDENEGADGERVSSGEPAQLARLVVDAERATNDVLGHDAEGKTGLSEELGGADERDEEGFAGDGLGAFDFEIKGLKLMAFSVAVVIVGLVEYAVFIVLIRGFGGGQPLC